MKKAEFVNLKDAVEHGREFGGWIFQSKDEKTVIWYNADHYTMTAILNDCPTSGDIKPWRDFE